MTRKINPKRLRSNSVTGEIAAIQAAANPVIQPPNHVKLAKDALPFWKSLIDARAKQLWNESDLELAACLARTKADIIELQNKICKEGYFIKVDKDEIVNPKHAVLETLVRRSIALSRILHVHAEASVGRSANASKVRDSQKKMEGFLKAQAENFEDFGDLIPMPWHNRTLT